MPSAAAISGVGKLFGTEVRLQKTPPRLARKAGTGHRCVQSGSEGGTREGDAAIWTRRASGLRNCPTRTVSGRTRAKAMPKPLVGVIGSRHLVNDRYPAQLAGEKNLRAVAEVSGALPVMFAGAPGITDIGSPAGRSRRRSADRRALQRSSDAFRRRNPIRATNPTMRTGTRSRCVWSRLAWSGPSPILGLCRGIQEMGVAYGSTLHPEIRDLPGRMNHRAIRLENGEIHPDQAVVFADRHEGPPGSRRRLRGAVRTGDDPRPTSLHGQGILEPGGPGRRRGRGGGRHDRGDPGSPARPASRWAFSGTPSTIRKPTRSTAPCSGPSATRSRQRGPA